MVVVCTLVLFVVDVACRCLLMLVLLFVVGVCCLLLLLLAVSCSSFDLIG